MRRVTDFCSPRSAGSHARQCRPIASCAASLALHNTPKPTSRSACVLPAIRSNGSSAISSTIPRACHFGRGRPDPSHCQNARRLLLRPLPLRERAAQCFNNTDRVRGQAATPTVLVEPSALPSPAGGEGAITNAAQAPFYQPPPPPPPPPPPEEPPPPLPPPLLLSLDPGAIEAEE